MNYPVVIHKDKKSDYGVTVPDLPGCFSAGSTFDQALENAKEAILLHVEGMLEDGDPVPSPKTIEQHRRNSDFTGGVWALVSVDLSAVSGKARRVNITLPERVLTQIDDFAEKHGESRSGFLVNAALEYLATSGKAR
jgi:predicted RNase H-like HicB family nuclease